MEAVIAKGSAKGSAKESAAESIKGSAIVSVMGNAISNAMGNAISNAMEIGKDNIKNETSKHPVSIEELFGIC